MESARLMIARPRGVFDATMAEEIIEFIEIKEMELESGFDRFCDLNYLDAMPLSFKKIQRFAGRRSGFNPNDVHVRAAFLASDPLHFGLARMYQLMLSSPRIDVRVFSELDPAAEWLGVSTAQLMP
jgi:hypothetical protein